MRKVLFTMLLFVGALTASAQIKPVSQGTYKTEHVGGFSDIYVKLNYATDGSYYAFVLKCADMYNPSTFTVVLGHSPQEAMQSVDALLDVLNNGNKGEIYTIDNTTSMKRQNKSTVYIFRDGDVDPGYVQRRHLEATKKFLEALL
jgi:hypothetical protein